MVHTSRFPIEYNLTTSPLYFKTDVGQITIHQVSKNEAIVEIKDSSEVYISSPYQLSGNLDSHLVEQKLRLRKYRIEIPGRYEFKSWPYESSQCDINGHSFEMEIGNHMVRFFNYNEIS